MKIFGEQNEGNPWLLQSADLKKNSGLVAVWRERFGGWQWQYQGLLTAIKNLQQDKYNQTTCNS
jgi:hypothetical protein